jgi:RNA polymerase sigma-70 factor (ECF subfamily)
MSSAVTCVDALYRNHAGYVRRALGRLAVPPAEVDDLAQELFLTVFRKAVALTDERAARAGLFQTARRVASNARRARDRAQARERATEPPRLDVCPEGRVTRRRAAERLERFLGALPPEQRSVFELSEIEGVPAPEIARRTGPNLNTVYARVRRLRGRWLARAAVMTVLVLSALVLLRSGCATEASEV